MAICVPSDPLVRRMRGFPALLYLFLYLLNIIVFSGIYYRQPAHSFYHSTAQYEFDYFNSDAALCARMDATTLLQSLE